VDTTAWSSKPKCSSPHGAYWMFSWAETAPRPLAKGRRVTASHRRPSTRVAGCGSVCIADIAHILIWLRNAHSVHHAVQRSKNGRMGAPASVGVTSVGVASVTRIQNAACFGEGCTCTVRSGRYRSATTRPTSALGGGENDGIGSEAMRAGTKS
jgi:hypothetical protein